MNSDQTALRAVRPALGKRVQGGRRSALLRLSLAIANEALLVADVNVQHDPKEDSNANAGNARKQAQQYFTLFHVCAVSLLGNLSGTTLHIANRAAG
jgi:hypothetical protein